MYKKKMERMRFVNLEGKKITLVWLAALEKFSKRNLTESIFITGFVAQQTHLLLEFQDVPAFYFFKFLFRSEKFFLYVAKKSSINRVIKNSRELGPIIRYKETFVNIFSTTKTIFFF